MTQILKRPILWLLTLIAMTTVSLAASAQADFPGTHFDFTKKAAATTTIDDITLTHNGNYQSARNALQLNSGKSATITAPKGYNITQVTLVNTSNLAYTSYYYEPTLATIGANCGTSTLSADNQTLTWTGSESSVTFTTKSTIHVEEWDFDATACSYVAGFYVVVERDASVDLEHITMTPADFRPGPDDDIVIDVANGQTFQGINYIFPSDVTIDPSCAGTVYLDINGRRMATTLYIYDTQALFSFSSAITKSGNYTVTIPAGALKATDGRTNNAITLNYSVGLKHFKYKVQLQLGGGVMPAGTTISVAGQPYKSGDVVSTTVGITDADVEAAVVGYDVTGITVNQPFTVGETSYDGSIIVNYEKLVVRVPSSQITPATGNFSLDEKYFNNICIKFPENITTSLYVTDAASLPAGLTLTGPDGTVRINSIAGWSESSEFYISFPTQYTLGTYTLSIPEDILTFESGNKNQALTFEWNLTAEFFVLDSHYGETLKALENITIPAPDGVKFKSCGVTSLQKVTYDADREPVTVDVPVTVSLTEDEATFTLTTPITEKGNCTFLIAEGAIVSTDGRKNREMYYSEYIDPTDYINIASTTPANYVIVDGPFNSIVLTLDGEYQASDLSFGETIVINNTNVAVTPSLQNGNTVTLTFADDVINYDSNNNNINIPEGFITSTAGAISRNVWIWNVWVNAPQVPLEFSGVKMGWDGEVVTTSGSAVEQIGVLLLQFAEPIELVEDADVEGITVTDDKGQPCQLYDMKYVTDGMFFLWVNPAKTAVGTYRLHVPAGLFAGTESGLLNGELSFDFVIADIATFNPETSIVDGETVDTLTELTLTAPAGVTFSHFTSYPDNYFFLRGAGIDENNEKIFNAATVADDGHTATLRLGNIKRNGEYTITIPKGYLRATEANTGNAEVVIRVNVDHSVLAGDANDNGIVDSADVETARNYMLGRSYGMGSDDDVVLKALDFNSDGEITIGELTKLIDIISE